MPPPTHPRPAFQALFWLAIAAVLWLTLSPADRLPPVPFNLWDKAQHALAFAALALIGLMAWPARAAHLRLYLAYACWERPSRLPSTFRGFAMVTWLTGLQTWRVSLW